MYKINKIVVTSLKKLKSFWRFVFSNGSSPPRFYLFYFLWQKLFWTQIRGQSRERSLPWRDTQTKEETFCKLHVHITSLKVTLLNSFLNSVTRSIPRLNSSSCEYSSYSLSALPIPCQYRSSRLVSRDLPCLRRWSGYSPSSVLI